MFESLLSLNPHFGQTPATPLKKEEEMVAVAHKTILPYDPTATKWQIYATSMPCISFKNFNQRLFEFSFVKSAAALLRWFMWAQRTPILLYWMASSGFVQNSLRTVSNSICDTLMINIGNWGAHWQHRRRSCMFEPLLSLNPQFGRTTATSLKKAEEMVAVAHKTMLPRDPAATTGQIHATSVRFPRIFGPWFLIWPPKITYI